MENRKEVLKYILENILNIIDIPADVDFNLWFEVHFQTKDAKIKKAVSDLIKEIKGTEL